MRLRQQRAAETPHEEKLRRCRRAEKAVTALQAMNLIYRLGGGRGGGHALWPTGSGIAWGDCSWFACLICAIAGIRLKHPDGWTGTLVEEGSDGTSPYLTLFLKEPQQTEGHVIVRLRKRPRPWHRGEPRFRWAECGGRDNPHPNGGPTWFKPTPERIAEFPFKRHFETLS